MSAREPQCATLTGSIRRRTAAQPDVASALGAVAVTTGAQTRYVVGAFQRRQRASRAFAGIHETCNRRFGWQLTPSLTDNGG